MNPERLDTLIGEYLTARIDPQALAELEAELQRDFTAARRLAELSLQETLLLDLPQLDSDLTATAAAPTGPDDGREATPRLRRSGTSRHRIARPRRVAWRVAVALVSLAAAVFLVWSQFLHPMGHPGADPVAHNAGEIVPDPAVSPSAEMPRLAAFSGTVTCQPPGGAPQPVQAGQTPRPGSILQTAPGGTLTLSYADGTQVRVASASILELPIVASAGKALALRSGSLAADVAHQPVGAPMSLRTPFAEAIVVGTRFNLSTDADRSRLTVTQGAVQFRRLSDKAGVLVQGLHEGEFAEAGVNLEPRVHLVGGGAVLLAESFDSTIWPVEWLRVAPETPPAINPTDGCLAIHATNTTRDWRNWYAVTRSSFPLGQLRFHARLKMPASSGELTTALCLYDQADSGQGDRENLEVLFRGDLVSVNRVSYPNAGSKNGNHPELQLAVDRDRFWRPDQWIEVTLQIDAGDVWVQVDGRDVYRGPHGLDRLSQIRLGLYVGLKQADQPCTVLFDDVLLEDITDLADQ